MGWGRWRRDVAPGNVLTGGMLRLGWRRGCVGVRGVGGWGEGLGVVVRVGGWGLAVWSVVLVWPVRLCGCSVARKFLADEDFAGLP